MYIMMCSAYKLNKQGDNIQLWLTPFPIWNQLVVSCPVLTVASSPAYRFLRRQISWPGTPISLRIFHSYVIHTVKDFGIVNKAEIDVSLELSCFFDDSADVGNLISDSSAFSKTSLNIWKFTVHILLKPGLENFKHYFTSMWDECNCVVVWAFFGIAFLWDLNENWPFPVLWPLLSFPNFLAYWVQHIKKKNRHYLTNKGPSRQTYGFSRSHIWMWKFDYKENWALKNWCFWTGVGEDSSESLELKGHQTSQS